MSKPYVYRSRSGRVSFLFERRTASVLAVLAAAALLLFLAGLTAGSTFIPPGAVIRHFLGIGSGDHAFALETLRLPRMLLAFLAGAALGVSGLVLQGIIRNPLGSPDVIGITGGASFAAVAFIVYLADTVSIGWLPAAALIGAGTVSLLIYALAWKNGISPVRLVLIGIGMSAAAGALTTMLIVFANDFTTSQAYLWMTGSVYGAKWDHVGALFRWTIVFIPLAMYFSRAANALELGDAAAAGIGVRVQAYRLGLLFVSVALAGSAVAYAGGIGFVGLIAPHLARRLVGRSFGGLVPAAALLGGSIVLAADIVARTAFLPHDLPAGIFVSGIGAPFFIYLLYKHRHHM